MPQNKQRDHKCSHHTAAAARESRWHRFHFSGKVIMCSVLFGFGLVLIGGIVMAIGMDRDDSTPDNKSETNEEIQNKAPMSIVGPILMGIGGFTVVVGIIMCLFETNICRKRQPDARPLIEEQGANSASSIADPTSIPSTTQGRDKRRIHKKSSPRKNKGISKRTSPDDKSKSGNFPRASPSSKPLDMQKSSSREFTSSDKFLTPPSSFVNEDVPLKPNLCNAENQTSASLLKSFTSSGKSWTTSTEFQTPSSSLRDSSGSFEERRKNIGTSPPLSSHEELTQKQSNDSRHEYLSPKSSNAEILDDEPESIQNNAIGDSLALMETTDDDLSGSSLEEKALDNLDPLQNEFNTPKNSYEDERKETIQTDLVLDNSSVSTLTNSQSLEDEEDNSNSLKSPISSDESEKIKIENGTIDNNAGVKNLNDMPQNSSVEHMNPITNCESNSPAPTSYNFPETSELPVNQSSTNAINETTDNIHTKSVTNEELNVDIQENSNHSLENNVETNIKVELNDNSSKDKNVTPQQ